MASPTCDKKLFSVVGSSLEDWLTNAFDAGSTCEVVSGDSSSLLEDLDFTWPVDEVIWSSNAAGRTGDIGSVALSEIRWEPEIEPEEMLWKSIDGLEASNLSRLVRVVRDWTSSWTDEVSPAVQSDPRESGEARASTESLIFDGSFLTLLHESDHKLLEREAGKDLWTWFVDWRDFVLSFAQRFETLSGEEVLNLLKTAVAVLRSAPRPRPPRQRQAPAERLLRLAMSIIPNAPPLPPRLEDLPTRAG